MEDYFQEYKKRYNELKKISEEVWKHVEYLLKEKKISIIKLANEIENKIIQLGAKPAFPVNISLNNIAAHFTPEFEDFEIDLEKHVVKIDFGIHIDGYIFDTARTYHTGNYSEILEVAKKAFEESLKEIKAGNKINLPGKVAEEIASQFNLKTIKNLAGHGLGHYIVHVEPTIINTNFKTDEEFVEGQPIAWEVFVTNGSGYVKDSFPSLIFEIKNPERINLIRVESVRKILDYAYKNFKTLPFTKRWLPFDRYSVNFAISEGIRMDIVHEYPVLKESENSVVAQFETTVIV